MTACLWISIAASAATTSKVSVRLAGKCEDVTGVRLVKDGQDVAPIPMTRVGKCDWVAATTGPTFSTAKSYFSLRLGKARSECHTAKAEETAENDWTAVIDVVCCNPSRTRQLTLQTTPALPIEYFRVVEEVPRLEGVMRSTPRPCVERGVFQYGAGEVEQVQFGAEQIYLQFGGADAKTFVGLPVPAVSDKEAVVVRKLLRDALVYERIKYRSGPLSTSAPRLSGNAIDSDQLLVPIDELNWTVK